jgi:hypothetical protein
MEVKPHESIHLVFSNPNTTLVLLPLNCIHKLSVASIAIGLFGKKEMKEKMTAENNVLL